MADPRTVIRLDSSGFKIEHKNSVTETFPAACLSRSKLLQDLRRNSEITGEAVIPVDVDACLDWVQFVKHASRETADGQSAAGQAGNPARLSTDVDKADGFDANPQTRVDAIERRSSDLCRLLRVLLPALPCLSICTHLSFCVALRILIATGMRRHLAAWQHSNGVHARDCQSSAADF